jgi:hypothetical protein
MEQNQQQNDMQPMPPPKQRKGCGCLTGCLLALLICLILGLVGGRYGFVKFRAFISDTKPMELADVGITETDREVARAKVDILSKAIRNSRADEVIFTARDLNALVKAEARPEFQDALVVRIPDDRLVVDFSLPLDDIPGFGGRYANGTVEFEAKVRNGILEVYATAASFKGNPVPRRVMTDMRKRNLAGRIYENPNAIETLQHIQTLIVEGGRVTVRTIGN